MGQIVLLDDLTINQMAAGEVVERPANAVKELVDNAIDAEATRIIVEIKNGGKTFIKVTDNGKGIAKDDMELSIERHATSKIRKVDSFNEDYRMKEEGAVINWFEINTPVGYYSVNDTIGDIMESFRGKLAMLKIGAMLLKVLKGDSQPSDEPKKKKSKGTSVMGFKPSKEMLQLGYGFTVKRVISMLGGKFTKEQILKINAILNKVKKPKK